MPMICNGVRRLQLAVDLAVGDAEFISAGG
ncbi:hypothetical protein PENANT_c027G07733 [Penicillium antarcticum]|uniref:Uncharacterized protein n=1 Tax=Penicillium antarcticum TaxID=416450 RepID=A0A1V6PXP3_9EURO|nr:hypothetical protein PENANT_c027G07733 [Penicillium antarcticum]